MKIAGMRDRLLREEGGFTLPEMMVTMMIMIVVLFALYSIFDMSIRVFRFGNNKVEAVENARLGLEKMEREIRAAYPYDRAASNSHIFFSTSDSATAAMPSATQITFGNDLNGNRKLDCPNPSNCEFITYKRSQSGATRTLLRNVTSTGSSSGSGGAPVVEFVNGANGLNFAYLKSNGDPATQESEIELVRITLDIKVEGGANDGTQTLTTDVDLRNRESQGWSDDS
jgi:prepilin-type N-terminal cleavage/methylation domain-containing protein